MPMFRELCCSLHQSEEQPDVSANAETSALNNESRHGDNPKIF